MTIITIRRLSMSEEEETNSRLLDGRFIESERERERERGEREREMRERDRERKEREKGR